jgi:hypothetical protein
MTAQIFYRVEQLTANTCHSIIKLVAGVFILVALDGHARSEPTIDPGRAVIGMTKDQIRMCMGPPRSISGTGGELWTYRSGNRTKSAGSCEATLTFRDNTLGK